MIMLVSQKNKCSIDFATSKTKFYLRVHCNGYNGYINKTQIFKFKCLYILLLIDFT